MIILSIYYDCILAFFIENQQRKFILQMKYISTIQAIVPLTQHHIDVK